MYGFCPFLQLLQSIWNFSWVLKTTNRVEIVSTAVNEYPFWNTAWTFSFTSTDIWARWDNIQNKAGTFQAHAEIILSRPFWGGWFFTSDVLSWIVRCVLYILWKDNLQWSAFWYWVLRVCDPRLWTINDTIPNTRTSQAHYNFNVLQNSSIFREISRWNYMQRAWEAA